MRHIERVLTQPDRAEVMSTFDSENHYRFWSTTSFLQIVCKLEVFEFDMLESGVVERSCSFFKAIAQSSATANLTSQ